MYLCKHLQQAQSSENISIRPSRFYTSPVGPVVFKHLQQAQSFFIQLLQAHLFFYSSSRPSRFYTSNFYTAPSRLYTSPVCPAVFKRLKQAQSFLYISSRPSVCFIHLKQVRSFTCISSRPSLFYTFSVDQFEFKHLKYIF